MLTLPNLDTQASQHFMWHELLWLPTWGRAATEQDGLTSEILSNLLFLAHRMDQVRDLLGVPINVHCAYRPPAYNKQLRGAPDSAHLAYGTNVAAMDFNPDYGTEDMGIECQRARLILLGYLDQFQMRMENNGNDAHWIHLDTRQPAAGHPRYFIP